MRCHHHRAAKLAIHAEERVQEVLLRDGVELRRGLVEQQQVGLHHQRGRQGEQLLATAGQGIRLAPEPVLNAEEVAGLRHEPAHLALRRPQVLQTERHLVPHALAYDLVVRILEDVAHAARRFRNVHIAHRAPAYEHLARALPRGGDLRLRQAQQRRLTRTGIAHKQGERPAGHPPIHPAQHGLLGTRVREDEVADLERGRHRRRGGPGIPLAHAKRLLS